MEQEELPTPTKKKMEEEDTLECVQMCVCVCSRHSCVITHLFCLNGIKEKNIGVFFWDLVRK